MDQIWAEASRINRRAVEKDPQDDPYSDADMPPLATPFLWAQPRDKDVDALIRLLSMRSVRRFYLYP